MKNLLKVLGIIIFMLTETATVIANLFMLWFGISLMAHFPMGTTNIMLCCLGISLFSNIINSFITIYIVCWRYGLNENKK